MFVLRTTRLALRDFQRSDLAAYAELCRDPRMRRFHSGDEAAPGEAEQLLDLFIGWAREEPRHRFQLAITLPSGELLGSCGVRVTSEVERQASFGCELAPTSWGKGYAEEAGRAVIDYGFRELGLHRIYAETVAENEAAVRLAEKLGMRVEGVLRENRWFRGRWWSTTILAVLESEWGR
jgi:RimJ/RimL family protein N-acetyltransferase